MKIYLTNLDIALIIAMSIAIGVGIILFFLAGVYKVKHDYEAVIEKMGEFHKVIKEGWHFKMPLIYRRVGLYCVAPQIRRYVTKSGNKLSVTYQLEDTKKYHYSHIEFIVLMRKIEEENSEIDLAVLTSTFAKYGLKFINIKRVEE